MANGYDAQLMGAVNDRRNPEAEANRYLAETGAAYRVLPVGSANKCRTFVNGLWSRIKQ